MEQALIPINDIIAKGWQFYKADYKKFAKLLAIMAASYIVYLVYFSYLFIQINYWLALILGILIAIGFLFISFWIYICIIKLIDACLRNKPYEENSIFNNSLKNIIPVLWISILTFLIVLGGMFLFIIPAIFWGLWYSFAAYAAILEDNSPKGMKALAISKKLVKKRTWDTFGRMIFPTFFVELIIYLGALIILAILSIAGVNIETSASIISIILTLVMFALIPLLYSFQVILYNNLKETRPLNEPTQTAAPTQQ